MVFARHCHLAWRFPIVAFTFSADMVSLLSDSKVPLVVSGF